MSDTKMWVDDKRCPKCLTVGQWLFIYGSYVCKQCNDKWSASGLGHWNTAFNKGVDLGYGTLQKQLTEALEANTRANGAIADIANECKSYADKLAEAAKDTIRKDWLATHNFTVEPCEHNAGDDPSKEYWWDGYNTYHSINEAVDAAMARPEVHINLSHT